jgi:hypothetical protein
MRLVILNEALVDPDGTEAALVVSLEEKATVVCECTGFEDKNVGNFRLNYVHQGRHRPGSSLAQAEYHARPRAL